MKHGVIPEGLDVLHHCDNPPCIRPEHLFLGNDSDNQKDMVSKGRGNRKRKLTDEQVKIIRQYSYDSKYLAERFNVSLQYIGQLRHFKSRKNI